MVISVRCMSRMQRRITSIGQGAPAIMPVRRLRQVEFLEVGMVQFGDEHGRHAVQRRAVLVCHRLQRRERIEALAGEHHRRAMRDARQIADHHAEAVIQRHRDAHLVLLGVGHRLAEEVAVVEDVVVRERGTLRQPGGAGGELDVDRLVELQNAGQFRQARLLRGAAQSCTRCRTGSRPAPYPRRSG